MLEPDNNQCDPEGTSMIGRSQVPEKAIWHRCSGDREGPGEILVSSNDLGGLGLGRCREWAACV